MNKHLILLLLITFIMGSCAPVPVSPTSTPTATFHPTITPFPTPSMIPTVTPYPPLQTEGPYLLFTHDNSNFTIIDADGGGRRQFQLPDDGYVRDLNRSVSPNGNWLTYYTGSTEKPYDLTLNLLNLEDETTYQIANLLAPGYPENLMLTTLNKDLCPVEHPDCQKGAIPSDFASAITRTIDWSPDSQTLAFAAQIDGPSSDVYLFKIADKSIRRLINDLENVWSVEWSPNGEKILYTNFQSGNYMRQELYIADPNIPMVQSPKLILSGSFWSGEGWIDENSYFLWDGGEGAAPHAFRYLDTRTQQVTIFWKYESDGFVYLKDLSGIVVNVHPNQEDASSDSLEPGTYFISISGERTKLSDDRFFPMGKQSLEDSFFFRPLEGYIQ